MSQISLCVTNKIMLNVFEHISPNFNYKDT